MADMNKEKIVALYNMIKSGADFKMNIDANDPEHPDNEDQSKYSGSMGPMAKLSSMLSFLAKSTQNDEAFNHLAHLSSTVHDLPKDQLMAVAKMVNYLVNHAGKTVKQESVGENIVESTTTNLRRKIS